MTSGKKSKRIPRRPQPRRIQEGAPVPKFHERMVVKHCDGLTLKHNGVVRAMDEQRRLLDFIASTEEVDRDQEIVISRGIDTAAFERNPVFLLDHDRRAVLGRVVALGIGRVGNFDAFVGQAEFLPPGTSERVDVAWAEIRAGARNGISIGFLPLEIDPPTATRGRTLRRVELLEISSVTLPACRGCVVTGTSDAKSLADSQAALAAQTAAAVRGFLALKTKWAALEAKWATGLPYRLLIGPTRGIPPHQWDYQHDEPRLKLVREAAAIAAKEQTISVPPLRFMTSTTPGRADFRLEKAFMGMYSPGEGISLEWNLSPRDLIETTAHEIAHAKGMNEAEAEAFGKDFARRHAGELLGAAPPTQGAAALLLKASFFSELARLRGWSERELQGVLSRL